MGASLLSFVPHLTVRHYKVKKAKKEMEKCNAFVP